MYEKWIGSLLHLENETFFLSDVSFRYLKKKLQEFLQLHNLTIFKNNFFIYSITLKWITDIVICKKTAMWVRYHMQIFPYQWPLEPLPKGANTWRENNW